MKTFTTVAALVAGANALATRGDSCCFGLTASGGESGSLGQLDDGQVRIGGGLSPSQFCIDSNGIITDKNGRGCILTPPTTQFQCDTGATGTAGFSVSSSGQLEFQGSTNFKACETGQNGGLNIYTNPQASDVTGCVDVTLKADTCAGSGAGSSASASPSAPVSTSATTMMTSPVSTASTPVMSSPAGQSPSVSVVTFTTTVCSATESTQVIGNPGSLASSSGGSSSIAGGPSVPGGCSSSSTAGGSSVPGGSFPSTAGGSSVPGVSSSSTAGGPSVPGASSSPGTPGSSVPSGSGTTQSPSGGQTATPTSSGAACGTSLVSGSFETPHLIVPIDSSSPDEAVGTQFNGEISDTVSTIFNFDIPNSDQGKTCSLVFLFPKQEDLETSSFNFSGDGKLDFTQLSSPALQSTSFSNAPSVMKDLGDFTVSPGNSYPISSFSCPAGQTVAFEIANAGSTQLSFFQDWNPSPIGLFITVC